MEIIMTFAILSHLFIEKVKPRLLVLEKYEYNRNVIHVVSQH